MSFKPVRPVRVVVFDLDGTLYDSAPAIANCINGILASDERPLLDVPAVTNLIGDGSPMLVRRAYEATGGIPPSGLEARTRRFIEALGRVVASGEELYEGVATTLDRLKGAGIALAVCTNKPEGAARQALSTLEIDDRFEMVVGGDTLPVRKPDAGPLRAILAKLGADPDEAVMVGDNANDVATARAANVPAIAVSYGYPRGPVEALGADVVIDRFDTLLDLILPNTTQQ